MLAARWLDSFAAIVQWINSSESCNSYFYDTFPFFFLGVWGFFGFGFFGGGRGSFASSFPY